MQPAAPALLEGAAPATDSPRTRAAQSPQNILVLPSAHPDELPVKLIDLGFAERLDEHGRVLCRRTLGGTPGFRDPAMVSDPDCWCASADLYSTGRLLHAMAECHAPVVEGPLPVRRSLQCTLLHH